MPDRDVRTKLRDRYEQFARYEAHGKSALYEDIALCVARHAKVIDFLETVPHEKQQPNLLLASFRRCCGIAQNGNQFCTQLLKHQDAIRATMLAKSTQTNEPARCATLLPVLSMLPQPVALLEVGASAGLCLYPDQYAYQFNDHVVEPTHATSGTPMFRCAVTENMPIPVGLPTVAWRAGIDLNPLDLRSVEDIGWLEDLVWPEQTERLENLRLAVAIASREPKPHLVKADLFDSLVELVSEAPEGTTVVVFHSAVLAYVPSESRRSEFSKLVSSLDVTWVSNEHPLVFPDIARQLSSSPLQDQFLLSVNGKPVATTGPHGQSIAWF